MPQRSTVIRRSLLTGFQVLTRENISYFEDHEQPNKDSSEAEEDHREYAHPAIGSITLLLFSKAPVAYVVVGLTVSVLLDSSRY